MEYERIEPSEPEWALTRKVEDRIVRIPGDMFLWTAGLSVGASFLLQVMGRKSESLFVGQWAPTLLLLGIYREVIKQNRSGGVMH